MMHRKLYTATLLLLLGLLPLRAEQVRTASEAAGPYKVSSLASNFFIYGAGGVNVLTENGQSLPFNGIFKGGFDAGAGKWFSPWIGLRFGYQGMQLAEYTDDPRWRLTEGLTEVRGRQVYQAGIRYHYVHGDFLWNLSNSFGGYDRYRVWNLVPYAHMGVTHSYYLDGTTFKREFSAGVGLLNNFRLIDALSLFVDLRTNVLSPRAVKKTGKGIALASTANLGLTYNIGTSWWKRYGQEEPRPRYVFNALGDNLFFMLGGGVAYLAEGNIHTGISGNPTGTYGFSVGKWFSPFFGMRLGYQAGSLSEWVNEARPELNTTPGVYKGQNMFKLSPKYGYLHGDILWNLTHTFFGYKEKLVWGVSPYAHMGFSSAYPGAAANARTEIAGGVGLLNTFRVSDAIDIYLDLRPTVLKSSLLGAHRGGAFMGTATAGLSYNIGRYGWGRSDNYGDYMAKSKPAAVPTGRPPYVINGFFDNTWLSVSAGVNYLTEPDGPFKMGGGVVSPAFDINLGKWFAPWLGTRLGIQGYTLSEWVTEQRSHLTGGAISSHQGIPAYQASMSYFYVHNDFLWNVNNTFWGYKRDRVWSLIPYTHLGVFHSLYTQGRSFKREFTAGVGLINDFKVGKRTHVFVDLRESFLNERSVRRPDKGTVLNSTLTLGLTYDFFKNYWNSWEEVKSGKDRKAPVFNGLTDNMFVYLMGGANLVWEEGISKGINGIPTFTYEAGFGKWFSPVFGGRLAFQ